MEKTTATVPRQQVTGPSRLQQTAGNAAAVRAVRSTGVPAVPWQGPSAGERFLFARGSTDLRPGQQEALRAFAHTVPPDFRLTVHGTASAEGPAGFNETLAKARAERAVELLAEAGISPSRIDIILVHGAVPGEYRLHRAVVVDLTPPSPPERQTSVGEEAPRSPKASAIDVVAKVVPSQLGITFEREYVQRAYRPFGPVLYRLKIKVSVGGSVKGPWRGTKGVFSPEKMKTEFSRSFESEVNKVSLKVGTDGKAGLEWTTTSRARWMGVGPVIQLSSPVFDLFRGKAPPTDTDFVDLRGGVTWEGDLTALLPADVRSALVPEGLTVPGTATITLGVGLLPNPAVIARSAATAAGTEAVAGATALEVAAGVALPIGMIAFVGYGSYQLNEAHRSGRAEAMRESFADGYADILAQLTQPQPFVPNGGNLLGLDWRKLFAAAAAAYVSGSGPGFAEASSCQLAGRAAAAQEVVRLIESDPAALARLGVRHRTLYGDQVLQRASQYRQILRTQARTSLRGEMGLDLTK
jgi:hypothetical protein